MGKWNMKAGKRGGKVKKKGGGVITNRRFEIGSHLIYDLGGERGGTGL